MNERSSTLRLVAIVLALLGVGACLALAWVASWLPFGRSYSDGRQQLTDRPELHERVVVHGEAEPWTTGLGADRALRSRIAFAPDGRIAVYSALGSNERADLYWSERVGDGWLSRGPLLALNQPLAHEIAPYFDDEGSLYFASDRPGSAGFDIYVAAWDGAQFRNLYRIVDERVNGPWDEVDPSYDARSGELYFASNRPRTEALDEGADFDLYRIAFLADGSTSELEHLAKVCSASDERSPLMHPRGGALHFASRRSGGAGGYDLYRAGTAGPQQGFQAPTALDPLWNTSADELDPSFLDAGFTFTFRRTPSASKADAGRAVDAEELNAEAALPVEAEFPTSNAEAMGFWRVPSIELEALPGPLTALDFILIGAALALIALLIWLGRRWSALDILTKALIISLLVHLLLLALSRRVDIEQTIDPPKPRSTESLINLAFTPQEDTTMSMRGGAVERELSEQEDTPVERAELEVAEAEVAPQPLSTEEATIERESFESALPERNTAAERSNTETSSSVAVAAPEAPSVPIESAPELATSEPSAAAPEAMSSVALSTPSSTSAEMPAARSEATPAQPSEALATPERSTSALAQAERSSPTLERTAMNPAAQPITLPELALPEASGAGAAEAESSAELAEGPREVNPRATSESMDAPARTQSAAPVGSGSAVAIAPRATSSPSVAAPQRTTSADSSALARANPAVERNPSTSSSSIATRSPLEAMPLAPTQPTSGGSSSTSSEDLLADLAGPTSRNPARSESSSSTSTAPAGGPLGVSNPTQGALSPQASANGNQLAMERAAGAAALARPTEATERATSNTSSAVRAKTAEPRLDAPSGVPRTNSTAPGPTHSSEMLADLEPQAGAQRSGGPRQLGAALDHAPRPLAGPASASPRMSAPRPGAEMEVARAAMPDRPMIGNGGLNPSAQRAPAGVDRRFERRFGELKTRALEEGGGSAETENAVIAGLRYLAQKQDGRGFWGNAKFKHEKYAYTIYGKSGLAILAFLGAGHTSTSGSEFSGVVAKGIEFLLRAQDAKTGHFGNCSSYGHAISTYALCESYALTKDAALREPLQRAVDWIVENQNRRSPGSSEFGGWTYYFPDGHEFDPYARASITAWQVMALESARIGGFDVSPAVLSAARQFLEGCFDPNQGWFRYNHQPSRLRSIYPTLPGSTPASLFAMRLLGSPTDHRLYDGAWAYMLERRPKDFRRPRENEFVQDAASNLYFWYYGSLAFFQRGGEEWKTWNEALKRVVLPVQSKDGSWRPVEPYAESAGDTDDDRIYTTAMCVLTLEVYYRYFTPLLTKR